MSELRDRLVALAARGTRRGADDVLDAARRDARTPSAERASDTDGVEMSTTDDVLPLVTPETGRRRRRFGSFVAAAGIAALVGVGVLAVTAMFGSGGSDSPEGAVRQLADAISHKDPLAAVDVLVPSEVRSLRQTVHAATQKAADLKIVDDAGQPLAGVDLSVDHLALTSESLGDGFAKVTVTSGELSASAHKAQLSALLQKSATITGDAQGKADLSKLAANADLPTFVIVVRQDGRWYVSPAYTAFEYAREANGGPAADFGSAHAADLGAATPEAAVSDALRAAQAGNWDRVFALAPPDELPLYDYRAFLDQQAGDGGAPDFTIDQLSTTASIDGDTATVQLTASGVSGTDHRKWQVGGTCPSLFATLGSGGSVSEKFSNSGAPLSTGVTTPLSIGTSQGMVADPGPGLCISGNGDLLPFSLIGGATDSSQSSGPVPISVVREDGRWFVSPVTTVLGFVDKAIEHLDQRTAYTILGLAYQLPPDGTITIDQPFQVAAPPQLLASQVYAFDGHAGQEVVGELQSTGSSNAYAEVFATVYATDGKQVGQVNFTPAPTAAGVDGFSFVTSVTLPADGSYRLVIEPLFSAGTAQTLTLWNLADAPKALRDAAANNSGFGDICTAQPGLLGSSESCSGSATPTTLPVIPGSPGGSPSCTVTNGTIKCGGATLGSVCPAGVSPSATNDCIPADIANQIGKVSTGATTPSGSTSVSAVATTAPASSTTGP